LKRDKKLEEGGREIGGGRDFRVKGRVEWGQDEEPKDIRGVQDIQGKLEEEKKSASTRAVEGKNATGGNKSRGGIEAEVGGSQEGLASHNLHKKSR